MDEEVSIFRVYDDTINYQCEYIVPWYAVMAWGDVWAALKNITTSMMWSMKDAGSTVDNLTWVVIPPA